MNLGQFTRAERDQVKTLLVRAYGVGHIATGEVKVTSLGISSNPRCWRISAKTRAGLSYGRGIDTDRLDRNRADVHIRAVVSPAWFTEPLEKLVHREKERFRVSVICGRHPMTPPDGVDQMELLCLSNDADGGRLRLSTRYLFRLTTGDFTADVCASEKHPGKLAIAARLAHAEFRRLVAGSIARRLLPARDTHDSLADKVFKTAINAKGLSYNSFLGQAAARAHHLNSGKPFATQP